MVTQCWGLAGPAILPSMRRIRTLGLAAAVRHFNERAVPGLGGVWYVRQVLNAALGVAVAQRLQDQYGAPSAIQVANAIEGMACLLAFEHSRWARDARLRGRMKLQVHTARNLPFSEAGQAGFYVAQPMRMASVQTLPALGLVQAASRSRFNTFTLTEHGKDWLALAFEGRVIERLVNWVSGRVVNLKTPLMSGALSPLAPLSLSALRAFESRLLMGAIDEHPDDRERRCSVLRWVDETRLGCSQIQPAMLRRPCALSEDHWRDLQAGIRFFRLRDAAIVALDAAEDAMQLRATQMSKPPALATDTTLPDRVEAHVEAVRTAARAYLEIDVAQDDAAKFAHACASDNAPATLRLLASRDDQVLRLSDKTIVGGPAYGLRAVGDADAQPPAVPDSPSAVGGGLPADISRRVHAMRWLNLDIHGQLNDFLAPAEREIAA